MNKYVAIDLGSSRISAMAAEVQPNGMLKILAIESKAADDVKHGIVEQVSGAAFKVNEVLKLIQNSAYHDAIALFFLIHLRAGLRSPIVFLAKDI